MRKYVSEAIGTFALVFCGTGAIIVDQETNGGVTNVGIAITFGLIIMTMIYALGNISGAHFNPAVTIAFAVAKKFETREIFPYISSQLTGGIIASLVLSFLFPENEYLGSTIPDGSDMQSFVFEFIMTFFLVLVILNVAHGSKEQGMFAGLAIGGTVLLEAMFGGPISGASMNPVRSFAPALVSANFEHLWLYILAPILAGMSAVFTWKYLNQDHPQVNSMA